MLGVKPCPYCGGEVEVVKLIPKGREDDVYRIQCNKCKALVARGVKFDKETVEEGKERIKQYNKYMRRLFRK